MSLFLCQVSVTFRQVQIKFGQTDDRERELLLIIPAIVGTKADRRKYKLLRQKACRTIVTVKLIRIISLLIAATHIEKHRIAVGDQRTVFITVKRQPGIITRFTIDVQLNDITVRRQSGWVQPVVFGWEILVVIRQYSVGGIEALHSIERRCNTTIHTGPVAIGIHEVVRHRGIQVFLCKSGSPDTFLISYCFNSSQCITHQYHTFLKLLPFRRICIQTRNNRQRHTFTHTNILRLCNVQQFTLTITQSKSQSFFTSCQCSLPLLHTILVAYQFFSILRSFIIRIFPVLVGERTIPQRRSGSKKHTCFQCLANGGSGTSQIIVRHNSRQVCLGFFQQADYIIYAIVIMRASRETRCRHIHIRISIYNRYRTETFQQAWIIVRFYTLHFSGKPQFLFRCDVRIEFHQQVQKQIAMTYRVIKYLPGVFCIPVRFILRR